MKKIISASAEYIAKLEAQASARREMILNTPNMEIPAGSTVYYISANGDDARDGRSPETAWRSTARLKKEELPYGSYVCFERGGIYRGQVGVVYDGVTYTAYGEGPKPEIHGSEYDGAVFGSWTEVEKNIWRYSILFDRDVGMLVMNQGEEHGMKIILDYGGECVRERVSGKVWEGYTSLDENCEFFHDLGGMAVRNPDGGYLYLYCDRGNPAKVWNSIEFVMHGSIFPNMRKNDVTFDNLCLKYSNFGISSGGNNLRVQNCEIGWIGGALMRYSDSGYAIRYGNAVEIYGGCRNFVCENNWVYQCYDAGLTQ